MAPGFQLELLGCVPIYGDGEEWCGERFVREIFQFGPIDLGMSVSH